MKPFYAGFTHTASLVLKLFLALILLPLTSSFSAGQTPKVLELTKALSSPGQAPNDLEATRPTPSAPGRVLEQATAIAAGGYHACALTTAGGVKCWGRNDYGQLGDGTNTNRRTPVDVVGLTSGVSAVAAGYNHTCALTTVGGVKCWGWNSNGQLGDGTTTDRWMPIDVVGLTSGVSAVAAGGEYTCALTTAGGLKCWGRNSSGQLGDGTTTAHWVPMDVVGLTSGVSAVAAGYVHTCALTTAGGLKCWGWNNFGQLGDSTTADRWMPVDVVGLTSGVSMVTAGEFHTCSLVTAGGVKCWGWNNFGELGDGTIASHQTPVDVVGLTSGVIAVTAGVWHTCALTTAGGLKCWGNNGNGQLGDGTTTIRLMPVEVVGLTSGIGAVEVGVFYTCALTPTGELKCWGWNGYGQLGDGTITDRPLPVKVIGLTSGVSAVAAGWYHTCALTTAGGLKCWGSNYFGQLGDNTDTTRWMPMDVISLTSGVSAIAAGLNHTCALTTAGGVKCWGANDYGQLGDGTTTARWTPVEVVSLTSGVSAVAVGYFHTCVLTTARGVKCWGYNGSGQLGDGTNTDRWSPVDVVGLTSGVSAVAVFGRHTCALTTVGGVKCWGSNYSGQLGDGTTDDRWMPVDVVGLTSGVSVVAAGGWHTCALTTAGGVKCWGWNDHGQLGDGTTADHWTPVEMVNLTSGASAVTAGATYTCALTTARGIKCWGANDSGQLGDGTTTEHWTPVEVVDLTSGVSAVAAGGAHTCALTNAGGLKCWGENGSGQLSVNPGWLPIDVVGFGGTAYSISGRVVNSDGQPLVGLTLSAGFGLEASTNVSGEYTITNVITGTYVILSPQTSSVFSPTVRIIAVPPEATGQDFVDTTVSRVYLPLVVR